MIKKIIAIVTILLVAEISFAADIAVLPTGAGAKTGADWTNAADWSTMSFTRGNTYYLADGTYGRKSISTAVSGATLITFKKATISAHGPATGWSDGMGDGQALIQSTGGLTATIDIYTSYIVWDGVVSGGSDTTGYGIAIIPPTNCAQANYPMGIPGIGHSSTTMSNVSISNTAFLNCGGAYDYAQIGLYSFPTAASVFTVSNNYFENGSSNMSFRYWTDSTITGNYFSGNWSSSTNHGQQISPGLGSNDITLTNNIFKDSTVFVVGAHTADNYRWLVYDNIIIGNGGTSLTAAFANADSGTADVVKQWQVHHNTFYDVSFGGRGALFVGTLSDVATDKSYAYNNLFYNCADPRMDNPSFTAGAIVHDYNAYIDVTGTKTTETNWQTGTGSPFVNAAGSDFHLISTAISVNTGTALSATYNTDYDGVTRPVGAGWDIGAYEFDGTYSIGGTVAGLTGTVVLQNNSGDDKTITANGTYSFLTSMATGSTYSVTVSSQPDNQTCSVSNGSGTVGTSNVADVNVTCVSYAAAPPRSFSNGRFSGGRFR